MIRFNDYQQAVISFRHGYAVAMASPGSGKTATVVGRIKALLAEGVRPDEILCLTFTKAGAQEMAVRAGLKEDYKRAGLPHRPFTTFHSWALGFIKHEAAALPFKVHHDWHGQPAPLCLPLEAARTLAQICRRIPDIEWKEAAGYISRMKRRGISPNEAEMAIEHDGEESYVQAYRKYEDALRAKGLLDFDSIMIEAARLLERRPDVRARWQYFSIMVDEGQDTDSVQWRVAKCISEEHGNILAVGDSNQGMFSWRGSESNLVGYFKGIFPTAQIFSLPINYRSSGAIVDYCKQIAPDKNETVLNLTTPNEHGVEPEFKLYGREDEEATGVINSCSDLGNSAILARTNRQLAAFEDECGQRSLRYKLLGKSGFWGQNEVKDTVACLGAVAMPNDAAVLRMLGARCDATKFLRKSDTRDMPSAITMLKQFQKHNPDSQSGKPVPLHRLLSRFSCGESTQDEAVRNMGQLIYSLRAETSAMPARAGMQRILERFGLLSFYDVAEEDEESRKNFDNDPRENILKLVEFAERHSTLQAFYDYTLRVRKATLARTNCLTLSTIHQAKGREWEYVFVVGVNEGMLPHAKGDLEEERRIYYVACSRAARRLTVSASGVPSEFIRDRVPKEAVAAVPDSWNEFQLQG